MRVVFRTDSSLHIGSGHVMRCLTLAGLLRNFGADVLFICREMRGNYTKLIEAAGYTVCLLSMSKAHFTGVINQLPWLEVTIEQDALDTLDAINSHNFSGIDWLIVDHYGLDATWEKLVKPAVKKLMVIDDLANRMHDCDVLLDQNYFASMTNSRYEPWVSTACRMLLGPRYALLQPEYAKLKTTIPQRDGIVRRVLVFFGGSDLTEQTAKILMVLCCSELAHLSVDIVIGANYPDLSGITTAVKDRPLTTLYQNIPSLAPLMAGADLFLGAGGATTWERLCLGLPSIVISVAENQELFTRDLVFDRYQMSLSGGQSTSPDDWKEAIIDLMSQPDRLVELSRNANHLVDGLGAKRIARALCGLDNLNLIIREAIFSDEGILLDWANELEARNQSFQTETINATEHAHWFARKISDPNCMLLIAEDEVGLPLGQVRFEETPDLLEAVVSISVDHSVRGLGLSRLILSQSISYWQQSHPGTKLVAEVRVENYRSEQLFKNLGFTSVLPRRAGSKTFELVS